MSPYLPFGNDWKYCVEDDDWINNSVGIRCSAEASKNCSFWSTEGSSVYETGAILEQTCWKKFHNLITIFGYCEKRVQNSLTKMYEAFFDFMISRSSDGPARELKIQSIKVFGNGDGDGGCSGNWAKYKFICIGKSNRVHVAFDRSDCDTDRHTKGEGGNITDYVIARSRSHYIHSVRKWNTCRK